MDTIKKHKDFQMPEDGPRAITDFFIARARPTMFESGRYGLIATKRTFRHAVDRNRAKRLLRAWIRECAGDMGDAADFVFIARTAILAAKLQEGVALMKKAIKKLKTK
ncbi:hypothetical protein FACS189421_14250 [Bacteroidia bacterium]|nr:hypothetical protein FACS189421_14250 [Bacteroidia bacterium]